MLLIVNLWCILFTIEETSCRKNSSIKRITSSLESWINIRGLEIIGKHSDELSPIGAQGIKAKAVAWNITQK